ncbi:MAG: hypothetical protein J7559_14625 [Cohnella sp.]|nr:hypothetical protein [Cohnella sp.]
MSHFVEKEAAMMSTSATTTQKNIGGILWLIVFACVGILWVSPLDVWPKMLLGWLIVSIAFAYVRTKQRYMNRLRAVSALTLTFVTAIGIWCAGLGISQCASAIRIETKYANGYALLLAFMLAASVTGWLLAAGFVRGAAERGGSPFRIVAGAWRVVSTDRRIWPLGMLASIFHMLSCLVAYNCGNALQVIVGIAAGFAQVKMLGVVNQPSAEGLSSRPEPVSQPQKANLFNGLPVLLLHILLLGFYLILAVTTHASFGYSWLLLLVLPWVSGAIYAMFAWLIGLYRPLYIFVIVIVVVANAVLLGVMIGIFDSMLFHIT